MFFLNINLINEIFWSNQILNSNRSKFSHSNAGHQFCTETPSLFLMPLLHLQKNSKYNTKLEYFSIKHDLSMILSMSYQNSGGILSKVYCINVTHHFWMNSVWPIWRPILYLRENSKCNIIVAYLSIWYDSEYVNIESKISNILKGDSRHHFCTKTPSPFLDLQKNVQIIHQIVVFSPKIWQL